MRTFKLEAIRGRVIGLKEHKLKFGVNKKHRERASKRISIVIVERRNFQSWLSRSQWAVGSQDAKKQSNLPAF